MAYNHAAEEKKFKDQWKQTGLCCSATFFVNCLTSIVNIHFAHILFT